LAYAGEEYGPTGCMWSDMPGWPTACWLRCKPVRGLGGIDPVTNLAAVIRRNFGEPADVLPATRD
jgi:hypothetical protein